MADVAPQAELPGFSDALLACLVEDAHVRADARLLRQQLEATIAAAEQARSETALPGRLLAALGRRKGPANPEEAAEIFARENVLRRQVQESERLAQHYTRELDAHLHTWLALNVPTYRHQCLARERVAEWAGTITDLQADLRELIKALGQARNNAVTGYDHATGRMSLTARELFEQASGLITNVENRLQRANAKAAELGDLPGITMLPLRETIHGLMNLEIALMQLEADRLARELENFEQRQLFDLQVPAGQAADAQVAQARAYLEQYREQLRAHYDPQVKPEETAAAIPEILDRFRRGGG
ncbi:MAG TPA: hypothetical protein VHD61_09895 [Lacunisphaera sp.]|nr:hypothetical protein [Lacunisphaera sp.]